MNSWMSRQIARQMDRPHDDKQTERQVNGQISKKREVERNIDRWTHRQKQDDGWTPAYVDKSRAKQMDGKTERWIC